MQTSFSKYKWMWIWKGRNLWPDWILIIISTWWWLTSSAMNTSSSMQHNNIPLTSMPPNWSNPEMFNILTLISSQKLHQFPNRRFVPAFLHRFDQQGLSLSVTQIFDVLSLAKCTQFFKYVIRHPKSISPSYFILTRNPPQRSKTDSPREPSLQLLVRKFTRTRAAWRLSSAATAAAAPTFLLGA